MFQLADISAFLHVVKYRSFSAASRAMFISQATVSMRIKSLEQEAGIQLLHRNKSKAELTEAGRAFLPYAQEIMALEKNAQETLENFRHGTRGTLTIAASETVCNWVIPRIFKKMCEAHADIEVIYQTDFTDSIIDKVADGIVCFGIIRGNFPSITDERFYSRLLAKDHIYFAAHERHPVFRKKSIVLKDIAQMPLIVYASKSDYWPHIKIIFDNNNLKPHVALHINDINAVKQFTNLGKHICCLSETTFEEGIQSGSLRIIPVQDYVPLPRYSLLIYRRDKKMTGVLKEFLDLVNSMAVLEWSARTDIKGTAEINRD